SSPPTPSTPACTKFRRVTPSQVLPALPTIRNMSRRPPERSTTTTPKPTAILQPSSRSVLQVYAPGRLQLHPGHCLIGGRYAPPRKTPFQAEEGPSDATTANHPSDPVAGVPGRVAGPGRAPGRAARQGNRQGRSGTGQENARGQAATADQQRAFGVPVPG